MTLALYALGSMVWSHAYLGGVEAITLVFVWLDRVFRHERLDDQAGCLAGMGYSSWCRPGLSMGSVAVLV